MLDCKPQGTFSTDYEIIENDSPLAEVVFNWGEQAKIRLQGKAYDVLKEGMLGSQWNLEHDGKVVATAKAPSIFFHSIDLSHGEETWNLRAVSTFSGDYEIASGSKALGIIARKYFTNRATIDCDPIVPLYLQLFAFCVVVFIWRRDATAASGAGS